MLQQAVRQFVVDLSGDEADGLYGLTYILPRNDAAGTVVCGGTHEDLDGAAPSSSFSEVNEDTLRHIRRRCDALCPSLAAVSPANDVAWAGARPGRAQVRVERDRRVGESAESGHHDDSTPSTHRCGWGRVVHNYGHGGSGMTLHWGCAEHAVDIVCGILRESGGGGGVAKL